MRYRRAARQRSRDANFFCAASAGRRPVSAPAGYRCGGFRGPRCLADADPCGRRLNAWDDAPCVLEGHILEKIPRKDRYLFEDESGRVVVEIEHETFGHLTVTPQDKVRLVGHVDWSSKHPNEVEVDALAIIQ